MILVVLCSGDLKFDSYCTAPKYKSTMVKLMHRLNFNGQHHFGPMREVPK